MGGGGSSGSSSSGVTVTPATASIRAGDTLQFSAKVSTMDHIVTWAVNGTVGGNATVGKITASGVYTEPAALPTPNSVSIEATSSSNPSISGKSSLMPDNPVPTVTTVPPAAVRVGNFSVTITRSKFVNGAEVMFGGQALTTKFVSATQLTATGTTTAEQKGTTVQLTVSNPDPGAMASSALMVKAKLVSGVGLLAGWQDASEVSGHCEKGIHASERTFPEVT
jgi:hypothetical protein